jgi:hypothetical protein
MSGAVERSGTTGQAKDLAEGAGESAPLKPKENFERRPHPLHFLNCACKAEDRYDCWAVRYDMPRAFYCQIDIDADGGPCECMCHDEEDDGV